MAVELKFDADIRRGGRDDDNDDNDQDASRKYLDKNQVTETLQDCLQSLIKDQPEDPCEYLMRQLLAGYKHGEEPADKSNSPVSQTSKRMKDLSKSAIGGGKALGESANLSGFSKGILGGSFGGSMGGSLKGKSVRELRQIAKDKGVPTKRLNKIEDDSDEEETLKDWISKA